MAADLPHADSSADLPTLQVVAHAWRYSRLLALHLSAFVLHPPQKCRAVATIFHAPAADDPKTAAVLEYFAARPPPAGVTWDFRELPPPRLCRRAIGRNLACVDSPADFLLMSDVDYIFGAGALDSAALALAVANAIKPSLCFPRSVLSSESHALGDAEINRVVDPDVYRLSSRGYVPTRMRFAIGGCQWIPGNFARERGYLRESRLFQRTAKQWVRTKCDVAFRRWANLPSVALDVSGVYRVRHSKRGRTDIGVEL